MCHWRYNEGQKPFNTAWIDPPVQPSNYTNVELFQLSIKSAFGIPAISQSAALFVMRIKWYDGATPVATLGKFRHAVEPVTGDCKALTEC